MVIFKRKKRKYGELRQPKLYKAPKQKREINLPELNLKTLRYVIWSAVFVIVVYIIGFSPFFQVQDIMVEGNELITNEQIIEAVPTGLNIFFVNRKNLSNQLKNELPELKEVLIIKGIPNALKISVLEFNKALIWKTQEKYYLVSNQGQVYKEVTAEIANFPEIPVVEDLNNLEVQKNQKILSPSFIAFVTNIYGAVEETINVKPGHFTIYETTVDVILQTDAGFSIKFDSLRASAKQLEDLKTVVVEKRDEIHEYVDLRVDGWAYYK